MSKSLNLASVEAHHNETMVNLVHEIEQKTLIFLNGKVQSFVDFGTVFVGPECLTTLSKPFWESVCGIRPTDLTFLAPREWRMPQLLRALGAFASSSEASKNGWNMDIPTGFSQHVFRINKIRGVLTVVKGASPVNCTTDVCAPKVP